MNIKQLNKNNNNIDKPDNNNSIINDKYKSIMKNGKIIVKITNDNSKNTIGNAWNQ